MTAPGVAVEGADVIPDGEALGEPAIELSLAEHGLAVLVDLDGADGSPSKQMRAGKQSASGAGK